MENNEKYILEHIKSHREELDLEELWSNVSPHIPKEKKKNRFIFWVLGYVLIGVAALSMLIITNDHSMENVLEISNENGKIAKHSSQNPSAESKNDNPLELVYNKTDQKDKESRYIDFSKNSKATSNTYEKSIKVNQIDKGELNYKNLDGETLNVLPSGSENFKNKEDKSVKASALVQEVAEEDNDSKRTSDLEFNLENKGASELRETKPMIRAISILPIELNVLGHKRKIFSGELPPFGITPAFINSKRNRFGLYVFGGGSIASRTLSARSKELESEQVRRSNTVKVLGAWQVEGGVGLSITPKLRFMTGINYTQNHEKARFESAYLVDFEIESNEIIYRQDGTIENINGTTNGQGIRRVEEIRYNQFKVIQIPIRMSYEVFSFDKMRLNLGAMMSYSISQRYVGFESLSASRESYSLTEDDEQKFRTKGAIAYGFYVESKSHLSKMWDLTFSLGYQKMKNINNRNYLIDQQYNSLSITGGVYRRF